jgi:hypothetical protein
VLPTPRPRGLATANAFHAAFWVIFVIAALGVATAAIAFPRRTTQTIELEAPRSHGSIVAGPSEALD